MTRDSNEGSGRDGRVEAAAAAWLAQRDGGLTPGQAEEFARWRRADPRHEEALARLESAIRRLESLPFVEPSALFEGRPDPLGARAGGSWARPAWKAAAWAAAALAVGFGIWWLRPAPGAYAATYATTAGGYQRLTLPDGSVIELNSSSEVRAQYSRLERRVALTRGEAHFTVAKDTDRPFVVTAAHVAVRAVGTAFDVRLAASEVDVLVTEGRIRLETPDGAGAEPPAGEAPTRYLGAGERAVVDIARPVKPKVEVVPQPVIAETLTWQKPRLVFVDTPLADVVRQFNRYNRTQLVLGDPGMGALPVGGSFMPDNVDAFVRLMQSTRNLTVEQRGDGALVLHRGPVR